MKTNGSFSKRIELCKELLDNIELEDLEEIYPIFINLTYPLTFKIFSDLIINYNLDNLKIQECNDIVQEFYLRFNKRKLLTYQNNYPFYNWLYTIIKNFFIEKVRERERMVEKYYEEIELMDNIKLLILNQKQDKTINQIDYEMYELKNKYKFNLKDIANIYHCSISTIKRRLQEINELIKNKLD